MARLYFDLLKTTSQRYYFALDSVPGIVEPGVGALSLLGRSPAVSDQSVVFRTPATATLTLTGLSLSSPSLLSPATAALAYQGRIAALTTELVLRVSAPLPIEAAEPTYEPTLETIMLVSPATAGLSLLGRLANVTEGGNIGFVSPGLASLTLTGLQVNYASLPDVGGITLAGRAPTLLTELIVFPEVGLLTLEGRDPSPAVPFQWVDDPPATGTTWV